MKRLYNTAMFYPLNILKRTIVLFFDPCVIDYNDGLSVLEVSEFSEPRGRHLYDTSKQRVAIMKAKEMLGFCRLTRYFKTVQVDRVPAFN